MIDEYCHNTDSEAAMPNYYIKYMYVLGPFLHQKQLSQQMLTQCTCTSVNANTGRLEHVMHALVA